MSTTLETIILIIVIIILILEVYRCVCCCKCGNGRQSGGGNDSDSDDGLPPPPSSRAFIMPPTTETGDEDADSVIRRAWMPAYNYIARLHEAVYEKDPWEEAAMRNMIKETDQCSVDLQTGEIFYDSKCIGRVEGVEDWENKNLPKTVPIVPPMGQ